MSIVLERPPLNETRKEWADWFNKAHLLLKEMAFLVNSVNIKKPNFEWASSTSVTVPGSTANPAIFKIDGVHYKQESDLTCDLSTTGLNGLDTGSIAANTPYYLYGVIDNGVLGVVASVTNPNTGPTGFESWTFIGSFATVSGGATITNFKSENGLYFSDNELESESHTGNTTPNAETFASLPTTVSSAYGILRVTGTNVGTAGRAAGTNDSGYNALICDLNVSGVTNHVVGFVQIITAQTIYLTVDNSANTALFDLLGWKEDPTRWQ